jgi:N-acyl homoserine lactone hydrolase
MRIYAFHCGGDRASRAVYDPLDPDFATVVYGPYFFFLITHPRGNVLFDTGLHTKWRGTGKDGEEGLAVEMGPDDDVVSRLATLGLAPGDISHVVVSHLHFDHAGGLQHFPHAPIVVHERELQFAHWPAVYARDLYDRDDFDHDLQWVEVRGEYDVFGDGTIVTLPTPGHSPGHQALVVRLASGMHVLVADTHYLTAKMRERRLPGIRWSPDAMVESWHKVEELERIHAAKLIFTHDLDFAETKPLAPDAWYE